MDKQDNFPVRIILQNIEQYSYARFKEGVKFVHIDRYYRSGRFNKTKVSSPKGGCFRQWRHFEYRIGSVNDPTAIEPLSFCPGCS